MTRKSDFFRSFARTPESGSDAGCATSKGDGAGTGTGASETRLDRVKTARGGVREVILIEAPDYGGGDP